MSILESQIKEYYIRKNNPLRIEQGDLLTSVPITQLLCVTEKDITTMDIEFHHMLVLSQDCDLEQFFNAQSKNKNSVGPYLHNVILLPCYFRNEMEEGSCIEYLNIIQDKFSKKQFEKVRKDEMLRYQYIQQDEKLNIPELYIDFKAYYTLHPNYLYAMYPDVYLATINALFRERISQRYSNYISRIGLPCLNQ